VIEAFPARRSDWAADDVNVRAGEYRVEGGAELAVPVAEPEPVARSPRSISRLRVCWVTQAPVGWAVIPAMCTTVLDNDEQIEPAQEGVILAVDVPLVGDVAIRVSTSAEG
jgi:hypothetical protein